MSDDDEEAARVERVLREAIDLAGGFVTLDGRVAPPLAAKLCGVEESTLRSWRAAEKGPAPYWRPAGAGSRLSYSLRDISAWIVGGRRRTATNRDE